MTSRRPHGSVLRTLRLRRSATSEPCRRKSSYPAAIGTGHGRGRARTTPRSSAPAFKMLRTISRSRCISISTRTQRHAPGRHLRNDWRRAIDRNHAWAEATGNHLFLGEVGVTTDQTSLTALDGMLTYMQQHTDAWQGATYWRSEEHT